VNVRNRLELEPYHWFFVVDNFVFAFWRVFVEKAQVENRGRKRLKAVESGGKVERKNALFLDKDFLKSGEKAGNEEKVDGTQGLGELW